MKKQMLLFIAAVLFFTACNINTNKEKPTVVDMDTTAKKIETPIPAPTKICYASVGKDSAALSLVINETNVVGDLMYKIVGKDSNKGTFVGSMKGDTLLGEYKFMSEGKESTRQVAFLVKDNMAVEGYGASIEKDGKMVFKNTAALSFGKGISMRKTDCK